MEVFRLVNENIRLEILPYGATLHSLKVRTPKGDFIEVLQHLDSSDHYLKDPFHRGAVIGPFAGRIGPGDFLEKAAYCKEHTLDTVLLHGGTCAWSKQYWDLANEEEGCIELSLPPTYHYPGSPSGRVRYTIAEETVRIEITALSNTSTYLNLTHHAYFHLDTSESIAHHQLQIPASRYLETNPIMIPTGSVCEVSPDLDFRNARPVLSDSFSGLDHCFALEDSEIQLMSKHSGLCMTVQTNQPGLVVYTPKTLPVYDKNVKQRGPWPAICLEPQGFPDAMHHKTFPSTETPAGTPLTNDITLSFSFVSTA